MPKSNSPSFVLTLPVKAGSAATSELDARFNAGMRLYNACLNEAQRRLRLSQNHSAWSLAKAMPSTIKGKPNKDKQDLFRAIHLETGWNEFSMMQFANNTANRSKWIAAKVDSNTQQSLGKRAFKATTRLIYGNANSVRFKTPERFRSMEGKSNKQGIRFKADQFVWGKLVLDLMIDRSNPYHAHGLESKIKFCRILRKEEKGVVRFYLQLVCEGLPYANPKNYVSSGVVGLDLNISNVAVVGDDRAELFPFAAGVPDISKDIAAIQRKMARSDRASNPDNYDNDFEVKRGNRVVTKKGKAKKRGKHSTFNKSKAYRKLQARKRELSRIRAARAKTQNQRLVNEILRMGSTIKTEDVSVKGWQKRWGKAISLKSPGTFQSELIRKAESAGGSVYKFPTQTTALSQTHLDGSRVKKSLSERVHRDVTGAVLHRDLMSAFLSRYVFDGKLSVSVLGDEYARMEPSLSEGWQRFNAQASSSKVSTKLQAASTPVEKFSTDLIELEQVLIRKDQENSSASFKTA